MTADNDVDGDGDGCDGCDGSSRRALRTNGGGAGPANGRDRGMLAVSMDNYTIPSIINRRP